MTKRPGRLALGGLLLAGLGYLAGILTAPKSGKETRQDIQRKALQAKADAEKRLKNMHSELNDLIDEAKATAKNVTTRAKSGLDEAIIRAQEARDKVRVILSAFHEGEPEDKDLRKAMSEAKKAIDHLKKYVGKHAEPKKG